MSSGFYNAEVWDTSEPITHTAYPEFQFVIFDVPYIRLNKKSIVEHSQYASHRIKECICSLKNKKYNELTGQDVTWWYSIYNIFNITTGSEHYWRIYKDLTYCIDKYFKITQREKPRQIWMESWLNNHNADEVLKKHDHTWDLHGYVSIDPQDTETVFLDWKNDSKELYRLKNKPGRIYIGPGSRPHYVNNIGTYTEKRITLGFDLIVKETEVFNLGFTPIILKDKNGI